MVRSRDFQTSTADDGTFNMQSLNLETPHLTDSFSGWTLTNPTNGQSSQAYNFTSNGIAWSGEAKKYTNNPPGSPSDYLPPPNWALEYPDGTYTSFPQLASNEHFQVWMRTAALPTFSKLWARNDQETMQAGTYTFDTYMSESSSSLAYFSPYCC